MFPFLQSIFSGAKETTKRERRNSPENPSTSLSNPDVWLWEAFGAGGPNTTAVNARAALGIPAFYAAEKRRAQTLASLSFGVFKKTDLGSERVEEHPLDYLISTCPHPLYNANILISTIVTNLDLHGNAYIHVERERNGDARRLTHIKPENVRDLIEEKLTGDYFYIVDVERFGSKTQKSIPVGDMIHLKGLTLDGFMGLDVVNLQKETFRATLANEKYESAFYENGAHINYAIETPLGFSPSMKSTFMDEWRKIFSGIKQAFKRPLFIDNGAKLHQLKMTPLEAGMVEAKKAKTGEMARISDVPAHMIGAGENSTYSSVEVMVTDFVQYSLRNTIKQLENEFNIKAFAPKEARKRAFFVKMNLDSLLRGDTKTRTEKIESEVKWGVITKNEARTLAGYNEVEGGDTYMTPANMNVLNETGEVLISAGATTSQADSN